jgi:hypothetical protein
MTGRVLPDVHLCGSVPLEDVDDVLRTVAATLGDHTARIPDGEVGPRSSWIAFQQARLQACPHLVERSKASGAYGTVRAFFRLADGIAPDDVELGPLGYARAAQESFARFDALQRQGVIREGTRFQVGLPTPLSLTMHFGDAEDQGLLEPVFGRHIRAELDEIGATLPHDRVAVQWEVVFEFAVLEGLRPAWFESPAPAIGERLATLGSWVPEAMELGYHLCYGDSGGRHFAEPHDATWLADQARRIARDVGRRVDWIHLPVPIERDDEAYFAPLRDLTLPPETTLYLGLIHREDGAAGARRRIDAASILTQPFGLSTECGLGREPAGELQSLLELHDQLARDAER